MSKTFLEVFFSCKLFQCVCAHVCLYTCMCVYVHVYVLCCFIFVFPSDLLHLSVLVATIVLNYKCSLFSRLGTQQLMFFFKTDSMGIFHFAETVVLCCVMLFFKWLQIFENDCSFRNSNIFLSKKFGFEM